MASSALGWRAAAHRAWAPGLGRAAHIRDIRAHTPRARALSPAPPARPSFLARGTRLGGDWLPTRRAPTQRLFAALPERAAGRCARPQTYRHAHCVEKVVDQRLGDVGADDTTAGEEGVGEGAAGGRAHIVRAPVVRDGDVEVCRAGRDRDCAWGGRAGCGREAGTAATRSGQCWECAPAPRTTPQPDTLAVAATAASNSITFFGGEPSCGPLPRTRKPRHLPPPLRALFGGAGRRARAPRGPAPDRRAGGRRRRPPRPPGKRCNRNRPGSTSLGHAQAGTPAWPPTVRGPPPPECATPVTEHGAWSASTAGARREPVRASGRQRRSQQRRPSWLFGLLQHTFMAARARRCPAQPERTIPPPRTAAVDPHQQPFPTRARPRRAGGTALSRAPRPSGARGPHRLQQSVAKPPALSAAFKATQATRGRAQLTAAEARSACAHRLPCCHHGER